MSGRVEGRRRLLGRPPAVASPSEVLPEPEPAVEVATATSGKLSLKLAMKASPGFWDEVLLSISYESSSNVKIVRGKDGR